MTARDYVLALLKDYKQMKIRIGILQYELEHPPKVRRDEVIQAMTFHSANTQERVGSSQISDPTGSIAARLPGEVGRINMEIAQNLSKVYAELAVLNETVDRLEYYIDQLRPEEAEVLRLYYLKGIPWREMATCCNYKFTERTLIRFRDNALRKICAWYESLAALGTINLSV